MSHTGELHIENCSHWESFTLSLSCVVFNRFLCEKGAGKDGLVRWFVPVSLCYICRMGFGVPMGQCFLSLPMLFAYCYWSKTVWVFRLFAFQFLSGERMLLKKLLGGEGGFCLSWGCVRVIWVFFPPKFRSEVWFSIETCSRRVKGFICPSVYVFIGVVELYVCVISESFVSLWAGTYWEDVQLTQLVPRFLGRTKLC